LRITAGFPQPFPFGYSSGFQNATGVIGATRPAASERAVGDWFEGHLPGGEEEEEEDGDRRH
jgi:hypothetical protein